MKHPIIILAPGRSGSTLLQRILNTSAEIIIWGEHAGFMIGLARSYYMLTKSEHINKNYYSRKNLDSSIIVGSFKDYNKSINWINSFDKESTQKNYRDLIIKQLNTGIDTEKITWGFKEILYTKNDYVMDMLLELFPSRKIIFSLRNPFNVIKSMILSWSQPNLLKTQLQSKDFTKLNQSIISYATRWNNVASSFQYWIEEKKISCHVVKYEDLIAEPEKSIKTIFNFLDFPIPTTALKPMSVKVECSQNSSHESEVRQIIFSLRNDIWQIVGNTAEYFDYDFSLVNNLKS
ncbi:MAG: sulfotransferase [Xenococcus sp. (in: cyanobacteria)]